MPPFLKKVASHRAQSGPAACGIIRYNQGVTDPRSPEKAEIAAIHEVAKILTLTQNLDRALEGAQDEPPSARSRFCVEVRILATSWMAAISAFSGERGSVTRRL